MLDLLERISFISCFILMRMYTDFIEMMSAYFPKFNSIQSNTVSSWIIQLNEQLAKCNSTNSDASAAANNLSFK